MSHYDPRDEDGFVDPADVLDDQELAEYAREHGDVRPRRVSR